MGPPREKWGKNVATLAPILTSMGIVFFCGFRAPLSFPGTFCSQFTFLRLLSPPERSTGWAHMHSVHASAVQTPLSISALLLKNAFQKTWFWLRFSVTWASDSAKKLKKTLLKTSTLKTMQNAGPGVTTTYEGSRDVRPRRPQKAFWEGKLKAGRQKARHVGQDFRPKAGNLGI